MKRLFSILIFLTPLMSLFAVIDIHHQQPLNIQPARPVNIELEFREGFSEIEKVKIFFRQTGETSYNEDELEPGTESNPKYSLKIDEFAGYTSNAEYYFVIYTNSGSIFTYPELQPELNPLRLSFNVPQDISDGFVLLSPDSAYLDIEGDLLIAVSLFAIADKVDHKSIKLYFDDKDVTDNARIFTNMLTYNAADLKQGVHSFYVKANLSDGTEVVSENWSTSFTKPNFELPLNLSGMARVAIKYNSTVKDTLDKADKEANFLLKFKGSSNWLRFNSKIFVSSLETSSQQAVNKYKMTFQVPYFNLTLGDHAPKMNSFLLNSKNVMGIHGDLHFSSFRLMYTYGNLKRSVDGKIRDDELIAGTFKQTNNALRLELGSPQNFLIGFGFAKNKDDKKSLNEDDYNYNDVLSTTPKDNLILGSDVRFSLLNQRCVFGTEIAMSLYNDNILDGAISNDDTTDIDLPFDPEAFENIFIINESMVPFKPGVTNLALRSYLRLFLYRNLLNISFTSYHWVSSNVASFSISFILAFPELYMLSKVCN